MHIRPPILDNPTLQPRHPHFLERLQPHVPTLHIDPTRIRRILQPQYPQPGGKGGESLGDERRGDGAGEDEGGEGGEEGEEREERGGVGEVEGC